MSFSPALPATRADSVEFFKELYRMDPAEQDRRLSVLDVPTLDHLFHTALDIQHFEVAAMIKAFLRKRTGGAAAPAQPATVRVDSAAMERRVIGEICLPVIPPGWVCITESEYQQLLKDRARVDEVDAGPDVGLHG